jgi:DNA modification methylase
MDIIPISNIVVEKRQRTSIDPGALADLKHSILERVLLHPPVVVERPDGKFSLLVGERRFRAIESISKEGKEFKCGTWTIKPGFIPVTTIQDVMSEADKFASEYDENIYRVDLSWQERVAALAALHELRKKENPKQTYQETAKEALQSAPMSEQVHQNVQAQRTQQAVVVAKNLLDPAIAGARNATEAYNIVLKREENAVKAALARKSLTIDESSIKVKVIHGDLKEVLVRLPEGSVDLILADPPYGIEAGSAGFRARTAIHHNYDDSPEEARRLALIILTEGFRVTKPRANLLMFTDIAHWEFLQARAKNLGWDPFRRPLLWQKSQSEGLAPWGASGPRITTEMIFYATKGKRGMTSSPTDVLPEARVKRGEKEHAAEKPVNLLKLLIDCCTLPGDLVLDPCCGSGSTLIAARMLKRHSIGIEVDKNYHDTAMARLSDKPNE